MKPIFKLSENDVNKILTHYGFEQVTIDIYFCSVGNVYLKLNNVKASQIENINQFEKELMKIESEQDFIDYIDFTVLNEENEIIFRHENIIEYFTDNGLLEIVENNEKNYNFLTSDRKPWWEE